MRQLRDYEKKLRTKRSHPNIHRVGDPLVPGQPMPDLVYGAEEAEDNPDGQPHTIEIKPRPKPRIPKFKPTEIRLCCAEVFIVETAIHEAPDPADMPPLPPTKKFRRSRKIVASAVTTAPSSAAMAHATMSFSEVSNVAEVRSDTPLIDVAASSTWSPSSSFKKRLPFTKISEPAKIAVSFFVLPLCCSSSSPCLSSDGCQSFNSGLSVFAAEPHRELVQVLEEIALECAVSGLAKTMIADTVKEHVVVTRVTLEANITVVTQTIQIFESPGVYQYQKMDALSVMPAITTPPSLPRPTPQRIQRNAATRMSIKVPGLNIRPAPEKHKKRPQLIDPEYFSVATCQLPAVLFEKATSNIGRFRPLENSAGASVILYAPEFLSSISKDVIIFECPYIFVKTVNLVSLSAVPSRKLVMTSNSIASSSNHALLWNEREMPIFVLPSREYPYYARIPRLATEAVEKAKFAVSVESTWFFPLKAKTSTNAVLLAKSGTPAGREIRDLPALQWAAERSEFDINTQWRETRPLQDDVNGLQRAKRISTLIERYACQVEDNFMAFSTDNLLKYVAPEAYNSWSVMRMCAHPLYGAAVIDTPTILIMNNTYYEPRPFSARPNIVKTAGSGFEGVVAVRSEVGVNLDSVELVDIPDVIGDISDIKSKLVNQVRKCLSFNSYNDIHFIKIFL